MATIDNMETGGAAIAQKNSEWYQGGKWCTSHGWCGHTTRGCQGVERKHAPGGGRGGVICYHCKSTSHLIKQCPTPRKEASPAGIAGGAMPSMTLKRPLMLSAFLPHGEHRKPNGPQGL